MPANGPKPLAKPLRVLPQPHKPGTLYALQLRLWKGVLRAEAIMEACDEKEVEIRIKSINCLVQAGMAFLKSIQAMEYKTQPASEPRPPLD